MIHEPAASMRCRTFAGAASADLSNTGLGAKLVQIHRFLLLNQSETYIAEKQGC